MLAPYVTEHLPAVDSGTVTPVARLSPLGKLSDEVGGLLLGVGVRASQPMLVWPVTVRVPVMATAPVGTFLVGSATLRPVTWKVPATWLWMWVGRPFATRLSTIRLGATGMYIAPE